MSRLAALLCLMLSLVASAASAKVSFDRWISDKSTVEFGADRMVTAPGDEVRLVLRQILAPDWHTYWINPGGPGLPTIIDWETPQGVDISPIKWPTPSRYSVPPFVNYGYGDEALFVSTLRVPPDWPEGAPIELTAKASWLICKDICVQETQNFKLTLPTAAAAQADLEFVALAQKAEQSQPKDVGQIGVYELGSASSDTLRLKFPLELVGDAGDIASDYVDPYFYPEEPGVVASAAAQKAYVDDDQVVVEMQRVDNGPGSLPAQLSGELTGVFATTSPDGAVSIRLTAVGPSETGSRAETTSSSASGGAPAGGSGGGLQDPTGSLSAMTFWTAAALAFVGGLILNIMPCVFPVLALKAMSLVATANQPRAERLAHVGAYTSGVLLSFLALAGVLIAFKSAGGDELWGFHLQSPPIVGALALILFVVGLNFSGVFEFSGRLSGVGSSLAEKKGHAGAFFTGVLAVVVASPCTAPFMITALGFALTQDAATGLAVFAALGLGFAAPLALLGLSPQLTRMLPKPGPWMVRFRQALAFPMYAAAAVLLWVLGGLAGRDAMLAGLVIFVLVAGALWALGSGAPSSRAGRRFSAAAAALCAVLAVGAFAAWLNVSPGERANAGPARFSVAAIDKARAEGQTVFVNVTADWCISCKGNEWWVLSSAPVEAALQSDDVLYIIGDWTTYDAEITAYLESFEHPGVPLYVAYPNGGEPIVLPQLLTESLVLDALAGAQTSPQTAAEAALK